LKEIADPEKLDKDRIRRSGGGRKKTAESQPSISEALEALVDPDSRGDPESPLRWTSKFGRAAGCFRGHKEKRKYRRI